MNFKSLLLWPKPAQVALAESLTTLQSGSHKLEICGTGSLGSQGVTFPPLPIFKNSTIRRLTIFKRLDR